MIRKTIDGHGISSGLAIATAQVFPSQQSSFEKRLNIEAVDQRIERFQFALQHTKIDVMKIRNYTEDRISVSQAAIFDSYLLFLDDSDFIKIIEDGIKSGRDPVEVINTFRTQAEAELLKLNDYFKDRRVDLDDILFRLVTHMLDETPYHFTEVNEETIIVLEQLTPSFMAMLHPDYIKGVIVKEGSPFSHTAMLAESIGIPIMRVINYDTHEINSGDTIIMDSDEEIIIVHPSENDIEAFQLQKKKNRDERQALEALKDKPTRTYDGVDIELMMNVNVKNHLDNIDSNGAEGIGLVRTELLFNTRYGIPEEEEQYNMYKSILKTTSQPVTVRTFDFGGDKWPNSEELKENNPLLGSRGVRYSFKYIDVFTSQLRALIRAGKYGELSILFPFVTTVDELKDLQRLVVNVEHELKDEGIVVNDTIKYGVMIETPGAAMMAEQFAHHCDFMALGTNDLVQYMFAADRSNENVSKYYDSRNPAVLKIIREAIQGARIAEKSITICGDAVRDKVMLPLLVGLGARTMSMDTDYILKSRALIQNLSVTSVEKLVDQALQADGGEQVELLVKDYLHYL